MTMTMAGGLGLPALLAAATIGLWAFALLPEFLTALLFFAAATTLRLVPSEVIFSGFASSAFWLVLSGFVIGTAIRKVGLADRVAGLVAPYLAGSWPALVAGTVGLTYALAFVMPSNMGRIAVLMPVVMALADRAGLAAQGAGPEGRDQVGRGRAGLALAVGFGTFQLSASILPANVPNLVMAGAAESAYGIHLSYLPYLALHAPVLGLLKGAVLAGCIILLFAPGPLVPATAGPAPGPMSAAEKRLAILLLATLALWMTDAVHGVPAAWIGLASACLCLMPRIGFLTGDEFATGVNVRTCLYIAGILGFAAVVTRTGLGDRVGEAVLSWLPLDPARPAASVAGLVGLATLLNFVVTANGIPALFTPLARLLAEGSGLPLATVLMVQVIGYATPLLPYQASPIVVAMGMGRVSARDGALLCLTVAAVTAVVLVPLDILWFRALGRL